MKALLFLIILPIAALAQIGGGIQQPPSDSSFVGTLSVSKGGTGATNASQAAAALGLGESNNVIHRRLRMAATMEDNGTNVTLNLTATGTNTWPSIRFGVRGGGGELYENLWMYPGQNTLNWIASAGFTWMSGPGPYQGTTWLAISSGGAITAPNATGTASNSIANVGTLDTRYNRITNGINATKTFVSYDGTTYTTNTIIVTNGVITSWTP